MKGLIEDVRHALRLYRRTPGTSLMLVAVLAIGMAFVAAFMSMYSDLFLRPPPGFEKGSPIVTFGITAGGNANGLPMDLIERIAAETTTLEQAAGAFPMPFLVGAEHQQTVGELVTSGFFSGVRPKLALGRGFSREEHDAEGAPVVVISWRNWQERFGGRPDVIGKTLEIESSQQMVISLGPQRQPDTAKDAPPKDFRIVGVMSKEFKGTLPTTKGQGGSAFWMPVERGLPLSLPPQMAADPSVMKRFAMMRGIGRRAPQASAAAVALELTSRYSKEEVMSQPGARYEVLDGVVFSTVTHRNTQRQLRLFLGGSVLLSLVAAANVSLFLLARAPGRRRELAIRMAVGAPLRRLARQLASEAAVLVVAGAVLGLALSVWLARFLRGLPFLRQAEWRDVTLFDWRVLTVVGIFLLLLALLVSLAPILGLKKLGIAAGSRQVAARPTLAQRIAGTLQISIAAVLAGAAIAFTWYLVSLLLADPGYRTDNIYAARYSMQLNGGALRIENGQFAGAVDAARRREAFGAVPGVKAVSLGGSAPAVQMSTMTMSAPDPADPQKQIRARFVQIDSSYVGLLGLKLMYGRNITGSETGGALVNQAYARRFFGREDVVGEAMPFMRMNAEPSQIVGVLKDLSFEHPTAEVEPLIFAPFGLMPSGIVLVESTLPAAVLQKQLQEVARTLDLNLLGNVLPLASARSDALAADRARGFLTIGTAVLVVLLAAFGFYGTQRYLVTAGRREYAIRASLGAGPRSLGRLVLKRGLLLGLPGLLLGIPLAWILVAWLRDNYVSREISPAVVTIGVVAGIAVLLFVASLGPARFARRTLPAPLLRED